MQQTFSIIALSLVLGVSLAAQERPVGPAVKPAVPASNPNGESTAAARFESLKKLAGEWRGKTRLEWNRETEQGTMEVGDITVIYRLTAGGTALMETLNAGLPTEMTTMYHMDGDDLVLTHYCSMGNQPHMKAQPADPGKPGVISFLCDGKGSNMKGESDAHMHAIVITLIDDNHIKTVWTMQDDGRPGHTRGFDLQRNATLGGGH